MLSLHNVYSAKVQFFFDSTKGFLDYFTFRCVFYAFRGQSDFAVGLSVSDKLSVLNSIPIALRHHDAIMELSVTLWLSFLSSAYTGWSRQRLPIWIGLSLAYL